VAPFSISFLVFDETFGVFIPVLAWDGGAGAAYPPNGTVTTGLFVPIPEGGSSSNEVGEYL